MSSSWNHRTRAVGRPWAFGVRLDAGFGFFRTALFLLGVGGVVFAGGWLGAG